MSTTLSTINSLVNDRRRDTGTTSVDMTGDGFRAINGALQIWNQIHDWEWQIEKMAITYNPGIDTYEIASSDNFKAVIDLRPTRPSEDKTRFYYISQNRFDEDTIHTNKFAIKTEAQEKYLRLQYNQGSSVVLNQANDVDGNGTWVGATAISDVADDNYEYLDSTGSISFSYSGTSGTLTNSTMNSVDCSRYYRRSTIYFNVYLQDVSNFTSITLKVGSSASNYITGAITTDYLGRTPVVGWNKFKLVWDGSTTEVGTVDKTAINYIQATIAYGSNPSTTANRIENFFISENVPLELEYYSTNMTVDISSSNAKGQIFNDSGATGDTTLWTGQWDYVNEAFVNSVMEIVSWITGEYDDRGIAVERIQAFVQPLRAKIPSRRRYPEILIGPDVNI